jgi:predicted nuclease of predicted toxin-antitoxin system
VKVKTDENLPEEIAESLRAAGHEASTILEQSMGGELDPDVASLCRREQRALITLDLGFADIRTYPPREYPSLIVLRPRRQRKLHVVSVFEHVLPMLEMEPLVGRLWIVEEERIRIRE